jgi:hypothetical protein
VAASVVVRVAGSEAVPVGAESQTCP